MTVIALIAIGQLALVYCLILLARRVQSCEHAVSEIRRLVTHREVEK